MIVYFKEKSKNTYIEWGIVLLGSLLIMYLIFVWINKLKVSPTLQIIHQDYLIVQEKTKPDTLITDQVKKEGYPYIASKIGKYYYPIDCNKAKSLSVKNMLYYKDKMSAEEAGYLPHKDCF